MVTPNKQPGITNKHEPIQINPIKSRWMALTKNKVILFGDIVTASSSKIILPFKHKRVRELVAQLGNKA